MLVAHEKGFLRFYPASGHSDAINLLPNKDPKLRFNDGKCDPYGNLWIGTMDKELAPAAGALYKIDSRGKVDMILEGTTVSNGMAWTDDHRYYYYIDSDSFEVWRFDYDIAEGQISNKEVAFTVPREYGAPDGMSIDRENMLWIAHWGGHCVRRWDPDKGEVLQQVQVPAPHVTSCCFGGPELDEMYITTARSGLNAEELKTYPLSGGLFKCLPGVTGTPIHYLKATHK
jgi:sugar lactone lactonase YvrE